MQNISLKNKILVILFLPVITILVLSGSLLYDKVMEQNRILKTKDYLEFSIDSNELLTSLQEEREMSLVFTSSYGKNHKNDLDNLRLDTDKKLKTLKKFLKTFDKDNYSKKLTTNIDKLTKELEKIEEIRLRIDSLSINDDKLLSYYTKSIKIILLLVNDVLSYSNDGSLSKKLQAYIVMENLTEVTSDERRILRAVFEKGKLSNQDYFEFSASISSENAFLDLFKKVATKKQLEYINKDAESLEHKQLEAFRDIIFNKSKYFKYKSFSRLWRINS